MKELTKTNGEIKEAVTEHCDSAEQVECSNRKFLDGKNDKEGKARSEVYKIVMSRCFVEVSISWKTYIYMKSLAESIKYPHECAEVIWGN